MQLSEQWVLVTGGARGLGQSITRALAREGAGVVINYLHSDAAAQALAEELGPRALQQLTLLAHRQRPSAFVAQLGYAESTQAAKAPA